MRVGYFLSAALFIPVFAVANPPGRVYLKSPFIEQMHLPISGGVLAGDTLYIAGTIGVDPDAKEPISATKEAQVIMSRIQDVVQRAGMTMNDIVSIQVFCTDMRSYGAFNRVYRAYFRRNYPARTFVGVTKLGAGARFEVKGIAVRQ